MRLFQLARLLLDPEVENFLSGLALARLEFLDGEFLYFGDLHDQLLCGTMAREEACADGELVSGQAQRFPGNAF